MASPARGYSIYSNGVLTGIGPANEQEWAHLESFVRADYERCRPDDTFEDLKRRACFSKEDQGWLKEWMALAARRAVEQGRLESVETVQPVANGDRAAA